MTYGSDKPAVAVDRRALMLGSASAVASLAFIGQLHAQEAEATPPPGEPFAPDHVKKLAAALAGSEYGKPRVEAPTPFNALTFEQYREIKFQADRSIWRGQGLDYEVELLALGWIYDIPVDISLVEGGRAHRLKADSSMFTLGALTDKAPTDAPFGFSGFALHGLLNRAEVKDEFVEFQGASYFKAIGRGEQYGLSARGLAINTARPVGEEFPIFRAYWIERPEPGASSIVVHALLDSVSATGAYRFAITPGVTTTMDVACTIFARKSLNHVGVAPLTSMYLLGPADKRRNGDIRPAVHDSEGLVVLNGRGERLWRPLTNPRTLQASAFMDTDPKGFGLSQRTRAFSAYEDLESRFDRRPTVWVEPQGNWGEGYVELIEIPAEEDIHDNIVAYWKPKTQIEPGTPVEFAYRLSWGEEVPIAWAGAYVVKTLAANARRPDVTQFVVDFAGPAVTDLRDLPVADLAASGGTISNLSVQRHPEIKGLRIRFDLGTAGTDIVELRLSLKLNDQLLSESWIYRWTRA